MQRHLPAAGSTCRARVGRPFIIGDEDGRRGELARVVILGIVVDSHGVSRGEGAAMGVVADVRGDERVVGEGACLEVQSRTGRARRRGSRSSSRAHRPVVTRDRVEVDEGVVLCHVETVRAVGLGAIRWASTQRIPSTRDRGRPSGWLWSRRCPGWSTAKGGSRWSR